MGLGSISDKTLEQARDKADTLRKQLKSGIASLIEWQRQANEDKAQRAKFMNFQQCADAYINARRAGWKNPKHIQQWQNTLSQYAFPVFGDLDVFSRSFGIDI